MSSGYPEQVHILMAKEDFEQSGVNSHLGLASPAEVSKWFGDDFASLPGLGVVLVLITNVGHHDPVILDRHSATLVLPDGSRIRPLDPSQMTAWLQDVKGFAKQAPTENWPDYESGITKVAKGERSGSVLVFRFPKGTPSGVFQVEYVLDLGAEGTAHVKQHIPLNLRS